MPAQEWECFLKESFTNALGRPLSNWSELREKFSLRSYGANEHLMLAGKEWRDIYFLFGGLIRVYYIDARGNQFTQHFYQKGEFISPLEDPQGMPCQFYIQSLDKNTLVIRADYKSLYSKDFNNEEWKLIELHFLKRVFLKNAKHESRLLLCDAHDRYNWFCKEHAELLDRLKQNQIASFLGVTPVTLSRIRSAIKKEE